MSSKFLCGLFWNHSGTDSQWNEHSVLKPYGSSDTLKSERIFPLLGCMQFSEQDIKRWDRACAVSADTWKKMLQQWGGSREQVCMLTGPSNFAIWTAHGFRTLEGQLLHTTS